MTSSILSANYNTILFEFGVILVTSKILHALLRNVFQPRVFSDLLVRRSPARHECLICLLGVLSCIIYISTVISSHLHNGGSWASCSPSSGCSP